MRYAFVRNFNPSYDYFLTRYFRQSEIRFDEETTYRDIAAKKQGFNSPPVEIPSDPVLRLFFDYRQNWKLHPEVRPAYYSLLDRVIGGTSKPQLAVLRELEKELPSGRTKLVFTRDEAAKIISNFHRRVVKPSLRNGLQDGADLGDLSVRFLTQDDRKSVEKVSDFGPERRAEEQRNAIQNLIARISALADDTISSEMQQLLEEHEKSVVSHYYIANAESKLGSQWSCEHSGQWTNINGFGKSPDHIELFLHPLRGLENRVYDNYHESDWIAYPMFYVIEDSPRIALK